MDYMVGLTRLELELVFKLLLSKAKAFKLVKIRACWTLSGDDDDDDDDEKWLVRLRQAAPQAKSLLYSPENTAYFSSLDVETNLLYSLGPLV